MTFTILAQAGVGLALAALALGVRPGWLAWAGAEGLTALGLAAAFGHLGRPRSAYRALANLGSSWLSRECLCLGLFLGLGLWVPAHQRHGAWSAAMQWPWALAGAAGLVCMASVYVHSAMPAWKRLQTHLAFHTTAVALGALLLGAVEPGHSGPAFLAAGAVMVQLVGTTAYLAGLGTGNPAARAGLRPALPPLAAGMALTAAGGLGCPILSMAYPGSAWLALGAALALAGQGLLRCGHLALGIHPMAAGWADIAYRPGRPSPWTEGRQG